MDYKEYPKSTCCLCSMWDDEYGCTYPPCLEEDKYDYDIKESEVDDW